MDFLPAEVLVFAVLFALCFVVEGAVVFFTSGARLEKISKEQVLASALVVCLAGPPVVYLATRRILITAIVAVGLVSVFIILWRGLSHTK